MLGTADVAAPSATFGPLPSVVLMNKIRYCHQHHHRLYPATSPHPERATTLVVVASCNE